MNEGGGPWSTDKVLESLKTCATKLLGDGSGLPEHVKIFLGGLEVNYIKILNAVFY